ncbi:MAG: TRAP transporter substrate-binding protein [Phreatobacter sp.]|nr:TRAP transporter substrate-binding protein [Phreatobacter sp.]
MTILFSTSCLAAGARRIAVAARLVSVAALLSAAAWVSNPAVAGEVAPQQHRLRIVGGLAGVTQHVRFELPFWTQELEQLSGGRLTATVHPFDRSGLRGQDMLQLIRLGVVPFGTALLSLVSGDEPELNAVDLPGLNPDLAMLKRTVDAYRPHLARVLHERYDVELLGIYTYPAQVIYCRSPFAGLADLAGRRVRTSSVSQSEMFERLGATPVIVPFAEMVGSISRGVVDCAVTGTLSGNEIGLTDVTTHMHAMAISWGLSFFGANSAAWDAIPPDLREVMRQGIAGLEERIWAAANQDTDNGIACNAGRMACPSGRAAKLKIVPITPEDDAVRQRIVKETVLPRWIERCGPDCADVWDRTLAPVHGIFLGNRPVTLSEGVARPAVQNVGP